MNSKDDIMKMIATEAHSPDSNDGYEGMTDEKIVGLRGIDCFNQTLADFITLHLSDGQLDGSEPVEIKHSCLAEAVTADELTTTLKDILSRPNYEKLQQICYDASCELLIGLQELPCPDEGFRLQRLSITIKRR